MADLMTDERPEDQPTGPGVDPGQEAREAPDTPASPDAPESAEATGAGTPVPDETASEANLPAAEAALASVEEAAESVKAAADDSPVGAPGGGDAGGGDAGGGDAGGGDAAGGETSGADGIDSVTLDEFAAQPGPSEDHASGLEMLGDVSLRVRIELGRTLMYVEDVLRLNTDSIIELDKAAGDQVSGRWAFAGRAGAVGCAPSREPQTSLSLSSDARLAWPVDRPILQCSENRGDPVEYP